MCQSLFFNKVAGLRPCEFCEITKKTFFTEHLWKTAFINQSFSININLTLMIVCTNTASFYLMEMFLLFQRHKLETALW